MPTEQKHTPSTSIDAKRTHTPEPWNTNAHPMEVRAADGSFVAMTVAVPVCIPSAANAARIVACVNACAGITENELSHGPVVALHRFSSVVNQRDELLATLRDLIAIDDINRMAGTHRYVDGSKHGKTWKRARAVAAKYPT